MTGTGPLLDQKPSTRSIPASNNVGVQGERRFLRLRVLHAGYRLFVGVPWHPTGQARWSLMPRQSRLGGPNGMRQREQRGQNLPRRNGGGGFNSGAMVREFGKLRQRLAALAGDERADQEYYRVLGEHGVKHSNEFGTAAAAARRAYCELAATAAQWEAEPPTDVAPAQGGFGFSEEPRCEPRTSGRRSNSWRTGTSTARCATSWSSFGKILVTSSSSGTARTNWITDTPLSAPDCSCETSRTFEDFLRFGSSGLHERIDAKRRRS